MFHSHNSSTVFVCHFEAINSSLLFLDGQRVYIFYREWKIYKILRKIYSESNFYSRKFREDNFLILGRISFNDVFRPGAKGGRGAPLPLNRAITTHGPHKILVDYKKEVSSHMLYIHFLIARILLKHI